MTLELNRVGDLPKGEAITALVYGRPKSGKTAFAGTAGDSAVIVNVGRGEETLKSSWFKKYNGANPFIVTVEEEIDPRTGLSLGKGFDKVSATLDTLIKDHREKFSTIVIDDMTFLQTMGMDKALQFNSATNKSQTLQNVVKQHDVIVPAVQDYGSQMSIVQQFLDWYCMEAKKGGFNFVVLAHEKDTYKRDKVGETPTVDTILPYFPGEKMPYAIAGMFDWVLHSEVVGSGAASRYQMRTIGNEKLMAGVRHAGLFPEVLPNPNFTKMLEAVKTNTPLK